MLATNCLNDHPLNLVLTNQNCQSCLNTNDTNNLTMSKVCKNCWLQEKIAKSSCNPIPEQGYTLYGSDISAGVIGHQWTSNKNLTRKNITKYYQDVYGVEYVDNNNTKENQTTTISFIEPTLPTHRGLTIFFTLFKLNQWSSSLSTSSANNNTSSNSSTSSSITPTPQSINILIRSGNNIIRN